MKKIKNIKATGFIFLFCFIFLSFFPWGCTSAPPALGIPEGMDVFLIKNSLFVRQSENTFILEFDLYNLKEGPRETEVSFKIQSLKNKKSISGWVEIPLQRGITTHTSIIQATDSFTAAITSQSDYVWYNIEYRVKSGEQKYSDLKSLFQAIKRYDLTVLGSDTWEAGSVVPVHVIAKDNDWKASYRKDKKGESQVSAVLLSRKNKEVFTQLIKTDMNDDVFLDIPVPTETGSYTLAITAEKEGSAMRETASFPVTVSRNIKIYITTDKPIYQPGQDIHIRALALGMEKKPVADFPAIITVYDGKGNKVFKTETQTTEFGLVYMDFKLASFVNNGLYKIEVQVDDVTAEKTVPVDSYVLPKFKLDCITDSDFYKPGSRILGNISSRYFFGKPVAGGEVLINTYIFDVEWNLQSSLSGYTDDEGIFTFNLPVPDYLVGSQLEQGLGSLRMDIQVKDKAHHTQTLQKIIRVADSQVIIYCMPETQNFGPGMQIGFYLLTTDPLGRPLAAENKVQVGDRDLRVLTNKSGYGSFSLDVERLPQVITVDSKTENAEKAQKTFSFSGGEDMTGYHILLRTDQPVYKEGDEIQFQVLSNLDTKRLYLEVIKEDKTVLTKTLEKNKETVTGGVSIAPGMEGIVRLSVYGICDDTTIVRNSKLVYIDPADELTLKVTPDRDVYLPGATVNLSVQAADEKGNPSQAAVGLLVVDEAVYALQENKPGLERVYFEVEDAFKKPRYEVHGFTYSDIFLNREKIDKTGAEVFLTSHAEDVPHGIEFAASREAIEEVKNKLAPHIEKECYYPVVKNLYKLIYTPEGNMKYNDESLSAQIQKIIDSEQINIYDLWKKPLLLNLDTNTIRIICTGWDMKKGTKDDMVYSFLTESLYTVYWDFIYKYDPPLEWEWDWAMDLFGGARDMMIPEMAMKSGREDEMVMENLKEESREADIRVRKYFPETLFVEPALILDEKGKGTVTFRAADSITEWRVSSTANSSKGELGSSVTGFKVFQDFFIDIDFPVRLTQNDEVSVPVAMYNYLPVSQAIDLSVRRDSWFELLDNPQKMRVLEPGEVSVEYFRVRVTGIGTHRFQVTAKGAAMSDAVERSIKIIPDGMMIPVSVSDRLKGTVENTLLIPEDAIGKSSSVILKIYPGLFSQVVEGLDSLFRLPSGCFEQTSSTTYPNILALRYMQEAGVVSPEIELKASAYINQGYQRLLTFECAGGGFEWFGNSPAHNILTAYGLMEFYEMSFVHSVDPGVIQRTQRFLVSKQQADGSFPPDAGGIPEGAIDAFTGNILRNTGYITWALAYSHDKSQAAGLASTYIKKNLSLTMDNFTLAICANGLLTLNSNDPAAHKILAELEKRKIVGDSGFYWNQDTPTSMYGTQDIAVIETTALVSHAMILGNSYGTSVSGAIDYLIRKKDAFGNWTSTQATIASLRTFIRSLSAASGDGSGKINISVNNRKLPAITISESDSDVMRMIDISSFIIKGTNTISITLDSGEDASFLYQLAGSYYIPHNRPVNVEAEPLGIGVEYDKSSLTVDDMIRVTVKVKNNYSDRDLNMMIVDIGVAPGFDVLTEDFSPVLNGGPLTRVEQAGRQLILYIDKIGSGKELIFSYRMKARFPMKVASPQTRFYSYYGNEEVTVLPPGIEVTGK
ncbi:MAG: hypothetical protein JXJ04_00240 [Spirochaetales bacterium]|nr:hypothetical protein [Spirochaetales bacterium]